MDTSKFDVVLDASDENFAKDLGLKEGVSINMLTPQFERTDGRIITYQPNTPEEYEALKLMNAENLKKVGCQVWDATEGRVHWLYPSEWYNHIPDDTEIVSISGEVETFKRGETDDDIRFGALAYGFIQQSH